MTAPFTPRISDLTPGQDARTSAAQSVVTLTRVALAAPDLAAGVTPTLDHLVRATAAVGAVYLGRDGEHRARYAVRAASGELPPALGLPGGLPATVPLMRALEGSARPLFLDSTGGGADRLSASAGGVGVASLAAAPIRVEGGPLLGAFVMYTAEPHVWDLEEAALFSMVAGTVAALAGRLAAEEQATLARETALRALGQMLEAWDGDSHGHTDRVAGLALGLAERLGLPAERRRALRWGAFLHDISKVTLLGARLPELSPVSESDAFAQMLGLLPPAALSVITDRHEFWNGGGFPAGKAGAQISLEAQLFALCDAYDALTNPRESVPWEPEEALADLQTRAGQEFDPDLVALLLEVVREALPQDVQED